MRGVLTLGLAIILVLAMLHWGQEHRYQRAWHPDNLIRLHVAAHSDDAEEQRVKLQVRDAVLHQLGPALRQLDSVPAARSHLAEVMPQLEAQLRDLPWLEGRTVQVQLVTERFPHRTYGQLALPAGDYHALRVTIDQGQGANWWCILFPPLCLVDAAVTYEEEARDQSGVLLLPEEECQPVPTRVRWLFWEYLRRLPWWSR